MGATCPAGGCDFSGPIEAVCGHLGGSSDSAHEGLSAPGEGGQEGAGFLPVPPHTLLIVGLLATVYLLDEGDEKGESASGSGGRGAGGSGPGEETTQGPSEGASKGASEGGSGGLV